MAIHLVLDHSALIPYGDKPQEEKEAIQKLGELLPEIDAIWYVSKEYLKTLHSVCRRELKHHHPLPKLQSSLLRISKDLLQLAKTKGWYCRERPLSNAKLKLHVIASSALKHVGPEFQTVMKIIEASDEDRELLAIAVETANIAKAIYLVTADRVLYQIATRLMQSQDLAQSLQPLAHIEILAPKDFVKRLDTA